MSIRVALLYVCFFTSGAAALIYEVVWQRMLTLVFGVATFSVAAVVSAFLAGLALGCRLFGGPADRSANCFATWGIPPPDCVRVQLQHWYPGRREASPLLHLPDVAAPANPDHRATPGRSIKPHRR